MTPTAFVLPGDPARLIRTLPDPRPQLAGVDPGRDEALLNRVRQRLSALMQFRASMCLRPSGHAKTFRGLNESGAMDKTTLGRVARAITGLTSARRGTVRIFAGDLARASAHSRQARWAPLPRGSGHLRLPEHARKVAAAFPAADPHCLGKPQCEIKTMFPSRKARANALGASLFDGAQQMLTRSPILRALARLLPFDDRPENLALVIVQALRRVIASLRDRGSSILPVKQNIHFSAKLETSSTSWSTHMASSTSRTTNCPPGASRLRAFPEFRFSTRTVRRHS